MHYPHPYILCEKYTGIAAISRGKTSRHRQERAPQRATQPTEQQQQQQHTTTEADHGNWIHHDESVVLCEDAGRTTAAGTNPDDAKDTIVCSVLVGFSVVATRDALFQHPLFIDRAYGVCCVNTIIVVISTAVFFSTTAILVIPVTILINNSSSNVITNGSRYE